MVYDIKQQYNIPMQAGQGMPVNLDAEQLKQGVDNSYLANRVKASTDNESNPLLMAGTTAAIWYGISQGMDVFNRSCSKEYENTAFGKLGAFGDKIATRFNNTAIGKYFNKMLGKGKDLGHWMSEKNSIAHALGNHSTQAEWSFAKTPGAGVHGFLAMDTVQVFDEYLTPISENSSKFSWLGGKQVNPQRLEQYGMKQADIDSFRNSLKGQSFNAQKLTLQKKELELLGYKKDFIDHIFNTRGTEGLEKIARAKKVRMLGFKSVGEFDALKKEILAHPEKVVETLERATKNGDIIVPIWRKGGTAGKIQSHLFGRQCSLKEYLNKYKATLGYGNKTALGRFLPKALAWLTEGCTNRMAGGKIGVMMQAGIFADMLIHTFKAPNGEKGKTLVERFVNDFTYFMALPIGIMAMHKIGGLKYAGMTTDQVKAYRSALAQFKTDVKAGLLSDKATYKARKKALNDMLKANVKNPITKIFKKVGSFINIGNETIPGRVSKSKWNLNLWRKSGNFFKNLVGVPMRIAIPLAIVSPFLAKLATKGAHTIFGRPSKSVLDEDKEEEPQMTPEQQQAMREALIKAMQEQAKAQQAQPPRIPQSPTNLINQYVKKVNSQSATLPDKSNVKDATAKLNTTQSTQSATLPSKPEKKRYIPSPDCQIEGGIAEDYTKAQAAMTKFDEAEKRVNDTLAMRW